jgi:DoxX-like protein
MRDIHLVARGTLAAVWIYQGLVPKILRPDTGELEIFRSTGVYPGDSLTGVMALGVAQMLLGVFHLAAWKSKAPLWAGLALLVVLSGGALMTRPDLFILPFNPATLIVMMLALSSIDLTALEPPK